jgi:hypothetical protein
MGFRLLLHWIHTCPSFSGQEYLCASITAFGFDLREHRVGEHINQ